MDDALLAKLLDGFEKLGRTLGLIESLERRTALLEELLNRVLEREYERRVAVERELKLSRQVRRHPAQMNLPPPTKGKRRGKAGRARRESTGAR